MGQEQSGEVGFEQAGDAEADVRIHGRDGRDSPTPPSTPDSLESGFRVMKVFRGSPASRSGLRAYEDFIVGAGGRSADYLADTLKASEGRDVELAVWSCVERSRRTVSLRPVKWNGPGLLGAAVRKEQLAGAADAAWHVLGVARGGPAEKAGLSPESDYIVGTPAEAFRHESDFSGLISESVEKGTAASVMVYSTTLERVVSTQRSFVTYRGGIGLRKYLLRPLITMSGIFVYCKCTAKRNVEIKPDPNWGGKGVLGAELATGLLHQVRRAPSAEGNVAAAAAQALRAATASAPTAGIHNVEREQSQAEVLQARDVSETTLRSTSGDDTA